MSNFSRQKDYLKKEYARYWLKARREKYGCTDYGYTLLSHLDQEVTGNKLVSRLDIRCGNSSLHFIDIRIFCSAVINYSIIKRGWEL